MHFITDIASYTLAKYIQVSNSHSSMPEIHDYEKYMYYMSPLSSGQRSSVYNLSTRKKSAESKTALK